MANRFQRSGIQQWGAQAGNAAAPRGMRQVAQAAGGYERAQSGGAPNRFQTSGIGRWGSMEGYVGAAQSWYTGANREGVTNGWDTDFWHRTYEQNQRFGEQGRLNTQFEADNATGVVTWDHLDSKGTHKFEFGDVYDNGKFQGNVYKKFDRDTANLMMADLLYDQKAKQKFFSDSDPKARLNREVIQTRETNNRDIPKALTAADFNADVHKRTVKFEEGSTDDKIVAAGAIGGALTTGTAAFALTAWTGPGAIAAGAIGAAVGGLVGGVGAYMNKDALTEQAARAYEITSMSNRTNGHAAAVATGFSQWGGFAGKLTVPGFSNLTQGIYDKSHGTIGDAKAEFYQLDKQGHSTVPKWVKGLDVVSAIGDAGLQFASPAGRLIYTTQMGAMIGGEVGEEALAGGRTFDYNRGEFDNTFTDDHGNLDLGAAAAGIGKIGIDALQVGMVHGLAGKVDLGRLAVGQKTVYGTRLLANRIPRALGGYNAAEKAALAGGGRVSEAAGVRHVVDAGGKLVGRKVTLSLLVPSEQLTFATAKALTRRATAKAGPNAVAADEFYRVATALATGESKVSTALVNGMSEGYEEAVQAVLEPLSHNERINYADIGNSALYGFAAGVGMGAGMAAHMPSLDKKLFGQAQTAQALRDGVISLTEKEWKSYTPTKKRSMAAMAGLEMETAQAAWRKVQDDMAMTRTAGVAGINKLGDAIRLQRASEASRAAPRYDGAFVIAPLESADENGRQRPGNAAVASAIQTAVNLNNHNRGLATHAVSLKRDLDEATAQATADPANTDKAQRVTDLRRMLENAALVAKWGQLIGDDLEARVSRMTNTTVSPAAVAAEVATTNQWLQDLYEEKAPRIAGGPAFTTDDRRAMARAVSMLFTRDPADQDGSFQMMLPQISVPLTIANAQNVLQVPSGVLGPLRADHDGDKMRAQNGLILDDEAFITARTGANVLGAGGSVNIEAPDNEKHNIENLAKSLASRNVTLRDYAQGTLNDIGADVKDRYRNAVDAKILDAVLDAFYTEVRANNKDARDKLVDGLAEHAGTALTEFSRDNLSNEWQWLDGVLRFRLEMFQEQFAEFRPDISPAPDTEDVEAHRRSPKARTRRMERAATPGDTMALLLAGDSDMRLSQSLHYSSLVAAVLSAEHAGARQDVAALAQLYEALGQDITTSELERLHAADEITARVYARLTRIANEASELRPEIGRVEALSLVANLAVEDADKQDDGSWVPNGKQITLTQFLLRQSLAQDRNDKKLIYDSSPELQARHARYRSMTYPPTQGRTGSKPVNAQRAFVAVVGNQQFITLLGDAAHVLGPNLTVEQWLRAYIGMDEVSRREEDRRLRWPSTPEYGAAARHDAPYSLASMGEVTAYRALVDAMIGVGHNRITVDRKIAEGRDLAAKHLHGELADRHYEASENYNKAHQDIRTALYAMLDLSPRLKHEELTADLVQRLLESNPDRAHEVMGLIPNAAANAVIHDLGNGNVVMSNWVYEMFAIKDSKHAEMHYWRNLVNSEWAAAGMDYRDENDDDEGSKGRQFHRLNRRIHRIMFNLATLEDGGVLYAKFVREMEEATDLESFLRWVNTTPGIRGRNAPIVGWVDDVAEFDMDKAGGGWKVNLSGAELRDSIATLAKGAEALVTDLSLEKASINDDIATTSAIRRYLKGKPVEGDEDLYNRLTKAIDEAHELGEGLGPQSMVYQIVASTRGLFGKAHTKGDSPTHLAGVGGLDSTRDAFDFSTVYQRAMAALTSTNLSAVDKHMSQVAKDAGRSMDANGRPVSWEKPSVKQVLDWMENADTRSAARAILFPQVLERTIDGRVQTQMLVGKSLSSLLNGTAHKNLFAVNDKLKLDSALRYLVMVEAEARNFGGHFSVQRVANEIMAARMSAATREQKDYDLEQMTVETLYWIAEILQGTSSIAAADKIVADRAMAGVDSLAPMLEEFRRAQRDVSLGKRMDLPPKDLAVAKKALQEQIDQRRKEAQAEVDKIHDRQRGLTDPAEIARLNKSVEAINADSDRFERKINLLLEDDLVARAVDMFSYPDDIDAQSAAQRVLVDFIVNNPHKVQSALSSHVTLDKLTTQLGPNNTGLVELTDEEWTELSLSVIAMYLDEQASITAPGVTIAPFPDADHTDYRRYYDRTFSYLIDDLFDPTSAIVQAGRKVHLRADRHTEEVDKADLLALLNRTVFNRFTTGEWTSDIPRKTIAAQTRLFSGSSGQAIAMAGISPRKEAAISAATRRTYTMPENADWTPLLSTVALDYTQVSSVDVFDPVEITLPGVGAVERPLAQLNNRFARSVAMTYTDANHQRVTIDLMAEDRNLGRPYVGDEQAAGSGLQEITLGRLRSSADRYTAARNLSPADVTFEVSFLHPESQPGGPEWFHNVFFEGTAFALDGDQYESLNEALWFSPQGINAVAGAAALEAAKNGLPALEVHPVPAASEVADLEADWRTDFAGMIRDKTQKLFESEMGSSRLDPVEFYNAVHKNMKLRHFVRGTLDGANELWPAERVIAQQRDFPNDAFPLADASLWVPTDEVLRTMLGEQGDQGVTPISGTVESDPAKIPTYRGPTPEMVSRFAPGLTSANDLELMDTEVVNRARQTQHVVRAQLNEQDYVDQDTRVKYHAALQGDIHGDRVAFSGQTGVGGFSPTKTMDAALQRAQGLLRAENISFNWFRRNIPWVGSRKPASPELSKMLLRELEEAIQNDGYRAGWIFRPSEPEKRPQGIISKVSGDKHMRLAPGDLVVVELDAFRGDWKKAAKDVAELANLGVTIVLGAADGTTDGRPEMAAVLDTLNYEGLIGSKHVFVPNYKNPRYANQRARTSSQSEMRGISPRNHIAILNVRGMGIQKGGAWIDDDDPRLRSISDTFDLIPNNFLGGFNTPVDHLEDNQIARVRLKLESLDTAEGRTLMRDQANRHLKGEERKAADAEFDASWAELMRRFADTDGIVLPQTGEMFGYGSIIPLVDVHDRILLYRHGTSAPRRGVGKFTLDELVKQELPSTDEPAGIAVFSSKPERAQSTHSGKVVAFNPRSNFGLEVEMHIDLQAYGDKKTLEWNGLKLLLTPRPSWFRLPDHGFFKDWGVNAVVNIDETVAKEAGDGFLNNHRNAFAFLGIDFTDDVAKFFGVDSGTAKTILQAVAANAERIPLEAAEMLMNANRLGEAFLNDMAPIATTLSSTVAPGWLAKIDDPTTVEAQITRAIVVYLCTKGAKVEDVLRTGGFNDTATSIDFESQLMPQEFTQYFDMAKKGSPLRVEINRRLNKQLYNPHADGTGYSLTQDFKLEIRLPGALPKKMRRKAKQISPAHRGDTGEIFTLHGQRGYTKSGTWNPWYTQGDKLVAKTKGEWKAQAQRFIDSGKSAQLNDALATIGSHLRVESPASGTLRAIHARNAATVDQVAEAFVKYQRSARRTSEGHGYHLGGASLFGGEPGSLIERFIHGEGTKGQINRGDFAELEKEIEQNSEHITAPLYRGLSRPPAAGEFPMQLGSWTRDAKIAVSYGKHVMLLKDGGEGVPVQNATMDEVLKAKTTLRATGVSYPMPGDPRYTIHEVEEVDEDPAAGVEGPGNYVLEAYLQFAEAHSTGDNPILNGQAFNEAEPQSVTAHSAATAYQTLRAITAKSKDSENARAFAEGRGVERFDADSEDGGAWRMLNDVDASSAEPWQAQSPAESARRANARDALAATRVAIDSRDEYGWDRPQREDYTAAASKIMHRLGLKDSQSEIVDYWVRQMLGRFAASDPADPEGHVSGKAALGAVEDIWWNIDRHYLPTVSAMIPLMHVNDLQLIHRANKTRSNGWHPRTSIEGDIVEAKTWDDVVKVSFGSAVASDALFDPLFLLATDGMMHSYQMATSDLLDLPVSMNMDLAIDLANPETNDLLISLDKNVDLLSREALIVDSERATLDSMIGGQRVAGEYRMQAAPASEIAKRREQIREWRKKNDVPMPMPTNMRNFRDYGAQYINEVTTTNGLIRGLINLRVGTAMLNPALYVSMGPEQWVRATLDRSASILTGTSTAGLSGRALASVGLSRFSVEQLKNLRTATTVLGRRSDFKAMLYADLFELRPGARGGNKLGRALERYARAGSWAQDPTRGMLGTTLARRYIEASLQYIDRAPTLTTLSTDTLAAALTFNPEYLKDKFPDVHQAALNHIAQLRSVKPTVAGAAFGGAVDTFAKSSRPWVNILGNLVLKIPLIFSNYAFNVLTTITGLQGLDSFTATLLDGRKKGPNSLVGRMQAAVRGEQFDPAKDEVFDMSSVIDGIDLSRSFIRGGLTHTGLFMAGLAAGGLGLSGEDDETKKRRRLAKLQGAGFIYDRDFENDFRNVDSIYMDWLPFGSQWWGVGKDDDGRPVAVGTLHWTLKQFLSPVIGMERFYETGDFREVGWGFRDAIGSFPLINTLMFDDAVQTASEFADMAKKEAAGLGGPSNMPKAAALLANGVGVYERMLFENSFVNQLYMSLDRYDRDPYKLPLRDSDGTIQRDIEGVAREQNLTIEQYIEQNRDQLKREIAGGEWQGQLYTDAETGEVKEGYLTRDHTGGVLHALTENRASMAFVMSLFSGQGFGSDYLRRNMVPKTREIEKEPLTDQQIRAVVRALSDAEGGQPALSLEELTYRIKGDAIRNKDWDTWNNVDSIAAKAMAHMGAEPLSVLDAQGREVLTHAGGRAIFHSLAKGSVHLGDESLQGIYITYDQRVKIQKEWTKELVQEGVDLGLDHSKAVSRMKRLWNGPYEDPSIKGLGDILWAKEEDISYKPVAKYMQLNTTYTMGPDGRPWATGATREGVLGALGLKPVRRLIVSEQAATGNDRLLNTTDLINGMNTGLRGLELINDSRYVPTDVEIGKSIEDAIKAAANQNYSPTKPYAKSGGYGGHGYRNYGGYRRNYGRRGYGHGGGGYSGGGGYFTRMYALPDSVSPYANDISFINTSNPLIRRGDIRRERVWSERGRLKQWQ